MEYEKPNVIRYFNYDLEKILDEYNHYYVSKAQLMPVHIQVLYLYFSNLAENSLQILINSNYNVKSALDIENIPHLYIKPYSQTEINNLVKKSNLKPIQFYGLASFSIYFFEFFLKYTKYNHEDSLTILFKNIPIIEHNINLLHNLI